MRVRQLKAGTASPNGDSGFKGSGFENKINFSRGDFTLTGYSSLNAMTNFISGNYTIYSGEMINITSNGYECVINEELASENELSVGDTITLCSVNDETESITLTIKGIYKDNTDASSSSSMFSSSSNNIIVSKLAVDSIENEFSDIEATIAPTIILNSTEDIENFTKEVTEKGLSSNYTVSTNASEIEKELKPLENLQSFSNMFLLIVLIIGSIILLVLNMINIRERKYEIGVLRAIGMKKSLVSMQFLVETFTVTLIAMIIALAIGSVISVPISNYMLESQVETVTEEAQSTANNFGMSSPNGMQGGKFNNMLASSNDANTSYVDEINASINMKVVLEMFAIALALTLISSLVSTISISRYNPLEILKNRS